MAIKSVTKKQSVTAIYLKKMTAALVVLSFLIITASVMRVEASLEYQISYITFDSMIVYVAIRIFQWILSKILTIYEEMEGGQN